MFTFTNERKWWSEFALCHATRQLLRMLSTVYANNMHSLAHNVRLECVCLPCASVCNVKSEFVTFAQIDATRTSSIQLYDFRILVIRHIHTHERKRKFTWKQSNGSNWHSWFILTLTIWLISYTAFIHSVIRFTHANITHTHTHVQRSPRAEPFVLSLLLLIPLYYIILFVARLYIIRMCAVCSCVCEWVGEQRTFRQTKLFLTMRNHVQ